MASPCEILIDCEVEQLARDCLNIAADEARRVEGHLSRYRDDNIVHQINNAQGKPVSVDQETATLLNFAHQLYQMSDGAFDITSGVLRKVWQFDGGSNVPSQSEIENVLNDIGWQRVTWNEPDVTIPDGMEIDFGGIGKEYAVDRAARLIADATAVPCLVNFGGDLAISTPRGDNAPWKVGVESLHGQDAPASHLINLSSGALATSGDARRFVIHDGHRYCHILDPRTGWPVRDAPRSVTVAADTCVQAGTMSTLAMLKGIDCEAFLEAQNIQYWVHR